MSVTPSPAISRTQAWLESLRPKTLPLGVIAIITGSALAYWTGHFKFPVALLALITTGILQILSNLANDYGDAVKVPTPKHASGRCAVCRKVLSPPLR